MKKYYHLTSFVNSQQILKYGFKTGKSGNLGPGIYFAFNPKDTFKKAQSKTKDSIIVVFLDVGRLNTVLKRHYDWSLKSVKKHGFDSVQKLNCQTGPEICIYEPHRIKIIGVVTWDKSSIKFMNVSSFNGIDESEFNFLSYGKKVIKMIINQSDRINSRFNSKPKHFNKKNHRKHYRAKRNNPIIKAICKNNNNNNNFSKFNGNIPLKFDPNNPPQCQIY